MKDTALQISAASTTTTLVAATLTNVAIPNADNGNRAKYVILVTHLVDVAFRPVQSGETPALGTLAVLPTEEFVGPINVAGFTHIRFNSVGGGDVTIVPLENQ